MKIAIMSDSHDRWDNLESAVLKANEFKCKYLLFAGDFMSPPGIPVLEKFAGKVIIVWGNNDGEKVGLTRKFDKSNNIELAGDIYEGKIDDLKVFMNHYPANAELAAKSGEYDLVIHGHTHRYRLEKYDQTILVNPGEIQGFVTAKAGFVIFDTETKKFDTINL